jgi:hypothetical protein
MKSRIGIFFYDGYVGVQPSVAGAVEAFIDLGHQVDLFLVEPLISVPPAQLPSKVRLHYVKPWTRYVLDLWRWISHRLGSQGRSGGPTPNNRNRLAGIKTALRSALLLIELPFLRMAFKRDASALDAIVAFDGSALLTAWPFVAGRRFVYWSLEVVPYRDIRDPMTRHIRQFELASIGHAAAIVTQAKERLALLLEDADLNRVPVSFVPNGPYSQIVETVGSTFFIDLFQIESQRVIVLHAGMISPDFLSREIAAACRGWPAKYVLVFHERQKRSLTEPYVSSVSEAGAGRALISAEPLPLESVGMAYRGAHIGLVAYADTDANLGTAWASSGKLSYYLKYGLPVVLVCSKRPPILDEYRFGVWVPDVAQIGEVLETIVADYDRFREDAKLAYKSLFDFKSAFLRFYAATFPEGQPPVGPDGNR